MAGEIRTGMGGWVFAPWRGEFYPIGHPQKDELNFASRAVSALEINSTFRQNQTPASFQKWAGDTPDNFVFSIKGPQFITHMKRLRDVEAPLGNFFASGVLSLGRRLGPIVWQLPPNFRFDAHRLAAFFALLPRSADAAVTTARGHDEKLKTDPWLDAAGVTKVRHAIEVRHESFATQEFVALLREHNVAMTIADTEGWPYLDATADFVYGRLQGAPGADRYTADEVDRWADRAAAWAAGKPMTDGPTIVPPEKRPNPRDVFLYFISTDKVRAPANAQRLMHRLGLVAPA